MVAGSDGDIEALNNTTLSSRQCKVRAVVADLWAVIAIRAFFWAVYQAYFLTFVSVFPRAVSDSFPYLSCRPYLPLCPPFS